MAQDARLFATGRQPPNECWLAHPANPRCLMSDARVSVLAAGRDLASSLVGFVVSRGLPRRRMIERKRHGSILGEFRQPPAGLAAYHRNAKASDRGVAPGDFRGADICAVSFGSEP